MRRRVRGWLLPLVLSVVAVAVVYLGFATVRASRLYFALTDPVRGFRGRVHQPEAALGFAPIPGAIGAEIFRDAPDVPLRYDRDGFRVPLDAADPAPRKRPLVLALGCSFTYGQGVAAEDAFAHLVGVDLGGSTINAGVCGYGLGQMLVLARRDLRRFRPDVVLLQYSPWLARRAVATRAPTSTGDVPTPYFSGTRKQLRLEPPRFRSRLFELEQGRYRAAEWSWPGLLGFLVRDGIPLVVHDQVNSVLELARVALGQVAAPTRDVDAVAETVVRQIVALARRHGARVVLVAIGAGIESERIPAGIGSSGALVVDANAALRLHLRAHEPTEDAYMSAYWQRRGTPPVWDAHPNELAHRVIAREIVRALQGAAVPMDAPDPGAAAPRT